MMRWRWDQGRLSYFQYDNLVKIAKVLLDLQGVQINQKGFDPLRKPLEDYTGLPFAPNHYRVWRNYARVFECAMLATSINGKLYATDFCKLLQLSSEEFSSDQYFNLLFSRFSYPFSQFEGYNTTQKQVFPFIAIMKFAMARGASGVSVADVFSYVIGNECCGLEEFSHYSKLTPISRTPIGDELRQVREMMCVMGQSTYMKWFAGKLYIDTLDFQSILNAVVPFVRIKRCADATEEFCRATVVDKELDIAKLDVELGSGGFDKVPLEFSVAEGGRVFKTHGRIERSPLVRKMFFKVHPELVCDACHLDVRYKYPWTEERNILELHHVLPLAATLNVSGTTTRLDDMVPLFPNCHKSIHIFYKVELERLGVSDFGSKAMAHEVYNRAKVRIPA